MSLPPKSNNRRPSLLGGSIRRNEEDPFMQRERQQWNQQQDPQAQNLEQMQEPLINLNGDYDPMPHSEFNDDSSQSAIGAPALATPILYANAEMVDEESAIGAASAITNDSSAASASTIVASNVTELNHYQVKSQVSERSFDHSSKTLVRSNKEDTVKTIVRHVDDECNTPDYEVNIFFNLCEVIIQPETTTSKEKNRWGNIRRWFVDHPEKEARHAAVVQQGGFSTTPLHLICQHPNCPIDIVRAMLECTDEIASWEDTNGWLPLHFACARNTSIEVIEELLRAYPDGDITQDKRQRTPLHFVFFKTEEEEEESEEFDTESIIMDITKNDQNENDEYENLRDVVHLLRRAVTIGDEKGRLPIHFAAAYGSHSLVFENLVEECPHSVYTKEGDGRTALHYVMANSHNDSSASVLNVLLRHMKGKNIDEIDDEGNQPLHLMISQAEQMRADTIKGKKGRQNTIDCLKIYLNSRPSSSADFLTAIQACPQWLRKVAVTHTHVQKILNKRTAACFPTAILLLDGYMYTVLIGCFSYAAYEHIAYRFGSISTLPDGVATAIKFCYVGATYFLVREIAQVVSMINLNTIRSYILQFENWLDMTVIVLIYHYCSSMVRRSNDFEYFSSSNIQPDYGSEDDMHFRTGVAVTVGALWFSIINFLKSTMLEFSVFYETVLYVTKNLFIFIISLAVILISFAQMFFIVYRQTPVCNASCAAADNGFPHCTFNKSFLKVFTMMIGEIGEVNRYQTSTTAQVFYIAFVFLVAILLSNILIAIVSDSYSVVKNERAEMVFWSNRLDFVAEMDTIDTMRKRFISMICRNRGHSAIQSEDNEEQENFQTKSRAAFAVLISILKDKFEEDVNMFEYCLFFSFRVVVIIFIFPIWFALGLVTAGLLWPPQVREWLFVMREGGGKEQRLINKVENDINQAKNSIADFKSRMIEDLAVSRSVQKKACSEVRNVRETFVHDLSELRQLAVDLKAIEKRKKRRSREMSLSRSSHSRGNRRASGDSSRRASADHVSRRSSGDHFIRKSGSGESRRSSMGTSSLHRRDFSEGASTRPRLERRMSDKSSRIEGFRGDMTD